MNEDLEELKLKYPTNINIDEYHNFVERYCKHCGKEFLVSFITEPAASQNQHCSDACRIAATALARKNRNKAKRQLHTKCIVCGNNIEQGQLGKIRKYCSNRCKKIIYNNKNYGNRKK